ncbi:hypothetical protein N0V88_005974 [Collariella sp. IMI 366227]|nr:hypothetical protein N0V88_005974 [Collariella sp. IMI 366227]
MSDAAEKSEANAVLARSNGTSLPSLAVCFVVVALLFGGYLAIARLASPPAVNVDAENNGEQLGFDDVPSQSVEPEDLALPLALRILPLLIVAIGVHMCVFPQPEHVGIVKVFLVGFLKAVAWFFTLKASHHSSWTIATTISTFALLSTRPPPSIVATNLLSFLRAFTQLLAPLLSLAQTIRFTPQNTTTWPRSCLWAFALLPLLFFLFPLRELHPVESLSITADTHFSYLLARQSQSYTAAAAEYTRRYAIPHPGLRIVFDMIHEAIAPFLRMSGAQVRKAVTHGVPFVTDASEDKDLCRHPEYQDMHGLVISPTTFLLLDGAVPVLTTGTLSTMADVLFPSTAYGDEGFVYDEARDVEWDKKQNNLYWAGSTTGGHATDVKTWKKYHRHRFVAMAQRLGSEMRRHWYLRKREGIFRRVASSFLSGDLYDVAFTAVIQCDMAACDSENKYFDMRPRADKDAALGSKLVFDIDGNGISGRFLKLLASRSAVLKQTLLREWHDERLVPWVHYFPVSQGLGEVPELVEWLTGTEEGRSRAKRVADQGREWAAKAMRDEDMGVYMYRLILELARLQDPEREAML